MEGTAARPNLILLITDQQRQPQHWPEDPAGSSGSRPNDAELRRTGDELHARVHRDRDVLAEPREPDDRQTPLAPRRDPDA